MKPPLLVSLLLVLLSVVGVSILTLGTHLWITVLMSTALAFSFVISIIYNKHSFLFVTIFFLNHFISMDGIYYTRASIVGVLFLFSPFILFVRKPSRLFPLLLTVALFVLYYSLVVVFSPYSLNIYWVTLHFEAIIVFCITYFFFWSKEDIKNVLLLHLLLLVVFGIAEILFTNQPRIRGPMQTATGFAVLLTIIWSIWVTMEIFEKIPRYYRIIGISTVTLVVLVASGTRMSLIGVVLTILLILFIKSFFVAKSSKIIKMVKFAVSFSCIVLLVTIIWFLLPDDLIVKQGFYSILRGEIDESNMGRLIVWYTGFQAFLENPVFGIGNGNFQQYLQETFAHIPFEMHHFSLSHAHNIFLVVLSENGALALLFIFIILGLANYYLVKYLRRPHSEAPMYGLVVGLVVLSVLGLFDTIPNFPSTFIWSAWYLGILLRSTLEEKNNNTYIASPLHNYGGAQ
ncbi:O-antigen ligase family protein [Chitinispirillales bacterium ANBcel5]|uniref:O-antigen ligase family protein n=1 Tax=Cellulosispirillum alkaliphilum TaxID=3039283 RepID=UPI002A500927|nr:O-antigen ligase family protein [Chitinispirillales bacterium ANBcel5]